ncbi:hypothetical protein [Enterococcus casseliflavus]|uniref:hypothetical protein n=1 Tax=Enterococcus casseliflavus TaxID=37734 RepID=UPI00201CDB02|nr:hypothetical protein [Enterococcus casseliflavus]MDT2954423.1 hypothetical protein [Enterococcus casseliflavus]MDT2957693.1 hypothetical protein [Enterococcus casseliflavus]UQZ98748.1 hypothetical protein HLJ12_15330 [Enterococcus casseliflavus]
MQKVIYYSIMEHIEKIIEDEEISDLYKHIYRTTQTHEDSDEFDFMIIDKLIRRFDFNRLTSRREISLTQFVSSFFSSPGHFEYAFVLKRLLDVSFLSLMHKVGVEGAYQSYSTDSFKNYITDGPDFDSNIVIFNDLISGFEFRLTENDVILTLSINIDAIENLAEFLLK